MSLVGKLVNLELKDGTVYARTCVTGEDDWSITIRFQNRPKMIPRTEIKSIQVTGNC